MMSASARYGVPLAVLYAVSRTEAGCEDRLNPYALNIDGHSFFPTSIDVALNKIRAAKMRGARMIDVGCMQLNQHYHGKNFRNLRAMLNPENNVNYGAKLLKKLHDQSGSWTLTVARYHTGDKNPREQRKYLCSIIKSLVDSGLGKMTNRARMFCSAPL